MLQQEIGASGKSHPQGVVQFKSKHKFSAVRKIMGKEYYFKVARNIHACISYCTKVDIRVAGPWTFGQVPTQPRAYHEVPRTFYEEVAVLDGFIFLGMSFSEMYRLEPDMVRKHI